MIYLELLLTFFKIGFFTIGGGYAMIPLIQQELMVNQWITAQEFVDIIAIAEMTPGPIAVNSATFIGYKTAGVLGALVATTAVTLPSLVIILSFAKVLERYQEHPIMKSVFAGIRPAVAGLIISAAWFIARSVLLPIDALEFKVGLLDLRSLLVAVAAFIVIKFFKADPIKVIIGAGVAGLIIF